MGVLTSVPRFAAVPPTGITDDFNRANGGLGANYRGISTILRNTIVSNTVQTVNTTSADSWDVWDTPMGSNDHWAEIDATSNTNADSGLLIRNDGAAVKGIVFSWNPNVGGSYILYSVDLGALIGAAVTGVGSAGTRRMRVEAIGSTIKGYINGVEVISRTDTTSVGQYVGIATYIAGVGASPTYDNFAAGNIPALWTDDFNRADGAFSDANITVDAGTWAIVSNQLGQTGDFVSPAQCRYTGTIGNNQSIEAKLYDAGDTFGFGLHVNCSTLGEFVGYTLKLETAAGPGDAWYLYRLAVLISGAGFTLTDGDTLKLERIGADVRILQNGVQLGSTYTDGTPLTGGSPSWWVKSGTITNVFDDITIRNE